MYCDDDTCPSCGLGGVRQQKSFLLCCAFFSNVVINANQKLLNREFYIVECAVMVAILCFPLGYTRTEYVEILFMRYSSTYLGCLYTVQYQGRSTGLEFRKLFLYFTIFQLVKTQIRQKKRKGKKKKFNLFGLGLPVKWGYHFHHRIVCNVSKLISLLLKKRFMSATVCQALCQAHGIQQ